MRVTVVKSRIRAERRLWSRHTLSPDVAQQPGFVDGVLRGLLEALKIIEGAQIEDICTVKAARRPLTRWNGIRLYNACRQAYGRLKESDRRGAMRILQAAIAMIARSPRDGT